MRLRINIAISLVALTTIVWGVGFAVAQERRRAPEYLQGMYQGLNQTFFENSLPVARLEWSDLTDENEAGETYQLNDDSFVLQVDRNTNFGDDDLQGIVEHETCHVATWGQEDKMHGPLFQACIARVKAHAKVDF